MIRVMVNGAGGKMGREVVKAVHADSELKLVGGDQSPPAGGFPAPSGRGGAGAMA